MAVGARSMTVPVEVVAEVGTNYCVEYCKDGENDWTSVLKHSLTPVLPE